MPVSPFLSWEKTELSSDLWEILGLEITLIMPHGRPNTVLTRFTQAVTLTYHSAAGTQRAHFKLKKGHQASETLAKSSHRYKGNESRFSRFKDALLFQKANWLLDLII